jgi:hypothetical protein
MGISNLKWWKYFTIFKNNGPGHIWRISETRFNIKNIVLSIKHDGRGMMIWSWFSEKDLDLLVKVNGKINYCNYI